VAAVAATATAPAATVPAAPVMAASELAAVLAAEQDSAVLLQTLPVCVTEGGAVIAVSTAAVAASTQQCTGCTILAAQ
jgi:hypothetical protein